MKSKVLLITPPFIQLNTPYPATVFLKGFLNTINIESLQIDLSIETILELFSAKSLEGIFNTIKSQNSELSDNVKRIILLKSEYLKTVDSVIEFLQNKKPSMAHLICSKSYLPKASRFNQIEDLDWAFGNMGIQDKAKYLATLYLEDLGDLIKGAVDPNFGFSRYAEHLGRYAYEFDELELELAKPNSLIDNVLTGLLNNRIMNFKPELLAITIPFPGNLFSAFRCAQFVKKNYPNVKIAMGGGFANTELRSLSDARVFDYFDYVCLDDGELPLKCIIEHIEKKRELFELKRTFALKEGQVGYFNGAREQDYTQSQLGLPDYSDLFLDKYLSVIEITNPMHSLWSNGRWNKLMLAHGCYWAKCSFCDTTLDYIKRYEPLRAKSLVDKMEKIIEQTGENGFHFVDEAAPPSLLRDLALEILRRNLSVVWWTNIRFEKNFVLDLCRLLSASGCIAVSGGIEVASDRLLKLINKGVDIKQITNAANNFTQAGIMVHAYLMYGYPTQTEQETIDSLEVVRQLFENGVLHSGFWHRFALTVHSPIAQNPDYYKISTENPTPGKFANNDIMYEEINGINHEKFTEGLKLSLYNYMQGVGFELPLQHWFNFKMPKTTITPLLIEQILNEKEFRPIKPENRIVWLGNVPGIDHYIKSKKGQDFNWAKLRFQNKEDDFMLNLDKDTAEWLRDFLQNAKNPDVNLLTVKQMEDDYNHNVKDNFQLFLHGKNMDVLKENGFLIL